MAETKGSVLPRNVTQATFDEAVGELKVLLGEENVLLQAPQLAPYRKIMMPVDIEEFAPSAAVTATTVEHVQ
ncbi:MAG TPA: 4-cresol dehydrogenase, partial [Pusillimonas sp.]|nr:4-cresol dehydrogenase [Pusillimonas sp.]